MDTSSGSAQAYPSTPGMYNLTTQVDGQTVYYTLRIPAGYDGDTALPVILCQHFVAAIPIAGTPRQTELEKLRDLPLYVIHSQDDRIVPIDDDAKAVERL